MKYSLGRNAYGHHHSPFYKPKVGGRGGDFYNSFEGAFWGLCVVPVLGRWLYEIYFM